MVIMPMTDCGKDFRASGVSGPRSLSRGVPTSRVRAGTGTWSRIDRVARLRLVTEGYNRP